MEKLFFVVNATAGAGRSGQLFDRVRTELDRRDIPYGCEFTEAKHHAETLVKAALLRGEKTIVAVGGDGTVNEVASIMRGRPETMGIMAFGTGNDIAKVLKLPTDPEGALDVLLNGTVRPMDAASANDRFFINVAGIGFDVDVLVNTERYKKHFHGIIPYMLGIFKALVKPTTLHMRIDADGELIEQEALLIALGNGTHFGGGMKVTPEADPFDGKLDVCIISKVNKLTFLSLLPGFLKGEHIKRTKYVRYFRACHVTVECAEGEHCVLDLDGELESGVPAEFTLLPGAINIIVKD